MTEDFDDFPSTPQPVGQPVPAYALYDKATYVEKYGPGRGFRKWKNPTREWQRMLLGPEIPRWFDPESIAPNERKLRVEIPPGGEIELPRFWDRSILRVHGGEVIGGAAPNLRPVGGAPMAMSAGLLGSVIPPFEGPDAA